MHSILKTFHKPLIRYTFLLLGILFFNTCEYEIHKVYEPDVNENVSPPEINIVELNIDIDTIFCYTEKEIRFKFVSSDQEITAIRFTIDNTQEDVYDSGNGIYKLDYWNSSGGIHSLKIDIYTGSGSGSIAEQLGMEGFLFSKTWVLVIDKNYSSRVKSTVCEGLLKLYWDNYRASDFNEYVVYRQTGSNMIEIARIRTNYYIDSSYVGEGTTYYVDVVYGESQKLTWGALYLQKQIPGLHLVVTASNEYIITWERTKYYAAVNTYNLFLGSISVKSTVNPEDTSYVLTTGSFGKTVNVKLRLRPKNEVFFSQGPLILFESNIENLILGYRYGGSNSHLTQISSDEFMYISGCDSLVTYSVSERRITGSYGYQTSGCIMCNFTDINPSASGMFITTYVDCAHNVLLTNSLDFSARKIRNLGFLTGSTKIPVSDRGIIIANNRGFYLYDFMKDSTLAFYNKDALSAKGLAISKDADYILLRSDSLRLVHYENSSFINVWSCSTSSEPAFYEFDGVNSDRIAIWYGTTFFIKRCSDFSTLIEFPLSEPILDIDYYNKRILTSSAGYLNIRSLDNGSLYKTIRYDFDPTSWNYACSLVDNAVVSTMGVIYFF